MIGAIVAAAKLSDRYIQNRFLPDKAIDLMDESASRLRMEIDSSPVEIDVLQRQVDRLRMIVMKSAKNIRCPTLVVHARQDELTSLVEPAVGEPFVLHPGEFVLGSTLEVCSLPNDLAGRLEGKSSLGRLGLLTHSTAGFIDPGFSGHITLELSNVANLPITLWPGMKIGQLCFFRLTSASENPYGSEKYGSRYQGQRGPTASRSFKNFHRTAL